MKDINLTTNKCKAKTKKGLQCSNFAMKDSKFCYIHGVLNMSKFPYNNIIKVGRFVLNLPKRFWSYFKFTIINPEIVFKKIAFLFLLPILILTIIYIFKAVIKNTIYIRPFDISKDLQDMGFTGEIMSTKLHDQYINIMNTVNSREKEPYAEYLASMSIPLFDPRIEQTSGKNIIPGTEITMTSFIHFIQDCFSINTHEVISDIIHFNNTIHLTSRVDNKPTRTFRGTINNIDSLLQLATQHVIQYTHPLILAEYLYDIDRDSSLEIYKFCTKSYPDYDDFIAYTKWSRILSEKKLYKESINILEKALEIKPKAYLIYNNIGKAYLDLNDTLKAKDNLLKCIELDPKHPLPRKNFANILRLEKKYKEAEKFYKETIIIVPDDPAIYEDWGNMYYNEDLRDYIKAIEKYEKVIKIKPEYFRVYPNLITSYMNTKQLNKAIELGEQYLGYVKKGAEKNHAKLIAADFIIYRKNVRLNKPTADRIDSLIKELLKAIQN